MVFSVFIMRLSFALVFLFTATTSITRKTQVEGVSLEELGLKDRRSRDLVADVGLEDDEAWELNQVYLAAKLAYMVEKPDLLASRPWVDETQTLTGDSSDPRFTYRVVTRTTERACYIAYLDPYGLDYEELIAARSDDVFNITVTSVITSLSSRTDPSKSCKVLGQVVSMHLPYSFDAELTSYQEGCVAAGKRIVLTGHSIGGSIATLEAVRSEAFEPWLITFGAMPVFKDECPYIAPERNVRIINTEVGLAFPTKDAMAKEARLLYDLVPWFYEVFIDYAEFVFVEIFPGGLRNILDFGHLHPEGGVTFLPPFPLRREPASAFVADPEGQNDPNMKPYVFWHLSEFSNITSYDWTFGDNIMLPLTSMRKYYYKIRELWLQDRLGVSSGFEHGTYCSDTKQCIESTTCQSPFDVSTKWCLYDETVVQQQCTIDSDCLGDNFCVDHVCSTGSNGQFCFDTSQCAVGTLCVKGRCSGGFKGEPCVDPAMDCPFGFCEVRQRDSYPQCWNTATGR